MIGKLKFPRRKPQEMYDSFIVKCQLKGLSVEPLSLGVDCLCPYTSTSQLPSLELFEAVVISDLQQHLDTIVFHFDGMG